MNTPYGYATALTKYRVVFAFQIAGCVGGAVLLTTLAGILAKIIAAGMNI